MNDIDRPENDINLDVIKRRLNVRHIRPSEFNITAPLDIHTLIAEVERLRALLTPDCGGLECKVVPMHYVDSCPTHQEDGGGFWYEGDGGTWADA